MFALGTFITEKLNAQGIKRSEFVKCLGYKNINKGLRALDQCIEHGEPHPFVVQNLPSALHVEPSVIEKVLKITQQQRLDKKEARERKSFRPHLWIITEEKRPTSITMALLTGFAHKTITLPPDITELPFERQLEMVKSVVRSHYAEGEGIWPFFGKILGYYYIHHFRENIRLDVEGNVTKKETTPFEEPEGYLVVGNKKVKGGLFNTTSHVEPAKKG